ncbi:transmembrane protein 125 [Protopterus annectens]|uniref:transmembrane protein 125 n=1 Tax=Protopterus annectens TaxID=7888 RepID=UPI001CFA78E7|nr:transmembrane protein 125 [Protopterus annectens]
MAELEDMSPPRTPPDPLEMQRNILDEHLDLWWFRHPKKSIVCFCFSVTLILACGIGGVVLLSTTSSRYGEWRLGIGTVLCLMALIILMKQLMTSAIQDMNCIRSREQIDMLKSGGFSDTIIILITSVILVTSGAVLLSLYEPQIAPYPAKTSNHMLITGIVLAVVGTLMLISVFLYFMFGLYSCHIPGPRTIRRDHTGVFTISGRLAGNQRPTTSSMANLI